MSPAKGYLALVLHAHLPFVRHPEFPDFLEEDWFFEAVVETYAPLLMRFEKLREEKVPFQVTMTVTPPLATMMQDGVLQSRLRLYLDKRIELLEKETKNAANDHVRFLAGYYLNEFTSIKDFVFNRHGGWILNSVRGLMNSGHIEVITCTATHGFLPLMRGADSWRHQISSAVKAHEKFFGRKPRGIWLAECGYAEGVDQILAENGIEYFFMDSHGLLYGDPQPLYGVYAPGMTPVGVNAFARDPESSKQVWSQKEGYPGDGEYREFYRDLGYEADYDYVKPYLHNDGERRGIGIKYHKITGSGVDMGGKQYYDPVKAGHKAEEHAANFMFNRQAQINFLSGQTHNPPIIVSPYDAELFGHWWYEGPQFLEFFIRKTVHDQKELELITCGDYLDRHPVRQLQKPNPSTWGAEGHSLVWLNGGNSWIYRHQHWAEEKMEELASRFASAYGDLARALNQLQRELLLMQSSDWAFIMTTGTTVPYATKRFREHLDRFRRLADQIENNRIDMGFVAFCEERDCIFPNADFRSAIPRDRHASLI
jgi:1,4-alpha-glucan branching enzyme